MASFGARLGAVMQVAYIVEDIEREMERWTRQLGVGPFFHLPHFPIQEMLHRGKRADLDIDLLAQRTEAGFAVAAMGSVAIGGRVAYLDTLHSLGGMIELIEITPAAEEFFGMIQLASAGWDGSDPVRVLGPR